MNTISMRLKYIDFLKGFAIFLMVMGHFLSWSFEEGLPTNNMSVRIVRDLIYAFHMPLFMFMSGYVIDIKNRNFSSSTSIWKLEKKRIQTLLIPCVTALVAGYLLRDRYLELPWFLIVLFFITSLFCLIKMACMIIKANKRVHYAMLFGGYVVLFLINRATEGTIVNEFFALTQTQIMYPYFVIGYLFQQENVYRYCKRFPIYTIAFISFCALFYFYHFLSLGNSARAMLRYALATAGILVSYELARNVNQSSKLYISYSKLGGGKFTNIPVILLLHPNIPRNRGTHRLGSPLRYCNLAYNYFYTVNIKSCCISLLRDNVLDSRQNNK